MNLREAERFCAFFHAFDQNLIIKYPDETEHGVHRWSNFQKCHFLDFPDFAWIHIFHKKCKIATFLEKCKNARECRKFTQKMLQKYSKKLRFWWKTCSEDHLTKRCRLHAAGQTSETDIFRNFMFLWKITKLPQNWVFETHSGKSLKITAIRIMNYWSMDQLILQV